MILGLRGYGKERTMRKEETMKKLREKEKGSKVHGQRNDKYVFWLERKGRESKREKNDAEERKLIVRRMGGNRRTERKEQAVNKSKEKGYIYIYNKF